MADAPVLVLDADRVRLFPRSSIANGSSAVRDIPWNPAQPDNAVLALQDGATGAAFTAGVVLVVGLGLLEIGAPDLPPLATSLRRSMLRRDADRYFPLDGDVAVSVTDAFAFALPAEQLRSWQRAFAALGPIRSIVTIAECLARSGGDGEWHLPAGVGESGLVVVRQGRLEHVRRTPRDVDDSHTSRTQTEDVYLAPAVTAATAMASAPLDRMLLDTALEREFAARRTRRTVSSVAALVAALVLLLFGADQWRARVLNATDASLRAIAPQAAPARQAAMRLAQLQAEAALLTDPSAADAHRVLARLSTVLPRDAFVQRLDWDGAVWRIDGSARNAPAIVPALDADPLFTNVRIVAATARFMDAGTQRESFSIAFGVNAGRSFTTSPSGRASDTTGRNRN